MSERQQITFEQLNERSNQLAAFLIKSGLEKDEVVPIIFDRSVEMFISILAILKSGCAYMPIDPHIPDGRKQKMIADASSKTLLVGEGYQIDSQAKCFEFGKFDLSGMAKSNIQIERFNSDPVYVLYTSGSTGNPKGIIAEHNSLINTIDWFIEKFGFNKMTYKTFLVDKLKSYLLTIILGGILLSVLVYLIMI